MLIRGVEKQDVDQLIELCSLHADFEKSSYDSADKKEKLHRHLFEGQGELQCLVVEEKGRLLGYATFFKQFSTWDASHYLYLDCLYLKEELRGKGVGTQLMQLIKSYGDQQECFQIQWQTPSFNKKAIEFYKKLGAVSKDKARFFGHKKGPSEYSERPNHLITTTVFNYLLATRLILKSKLS